MGKILKFLFLLALGPMNAQTNILYTTTWSPGTGSVAGFTANGTDAENVREHGTGPFGDSVLLWTAVPDAVSGPDGGWATERHNIDPMKTYRFSVWMKKTNSTDGNTLFGLRAYSATGVNNCLNLDGSINTNPYFLFGDLPQLDNWYLVVGFVHDSGYSSTTSIGGVYDINGVKAMSLTDFKFSADSSEMFNRAFLYYDANTDDRLYFWGPAIYEVNGQEPTLEELLSSNSEGTGTSEWTSSGTGIEYTLGNVGIGTAAQPSHRLAVDGKIRAKEVKVETANWPDYVFSKEYILPTLDEVERHILEKGRLINIPSAAQVESNGVELGEMDRLLLEKIEELTLYIIQLKKELDGRDQGERKFSGAND